jgi:large subunit ribosomal protein L4
MELTVLNTSGKETGRVVTLSEAVFGIEPNDHAIYLDVKQFLANQRQGTHKAKQRNEISGSTRKLKKQKGTGGARAGSIKNPQFKGGGRIFGPQPRDYSFKLNKKVKQAARRSALTYKAKEAAILVLEDFTFNAPKTKDYLKLLAALAVSDKKTLLVVPAHTPNVYLSSRNIPNAKVVTADSINTYEVLHAQNLILCEGSVAKINQMLAN